MRHQPGRWRSSLTAICLYACSAAVTAERLPFRAFGLEQGLPSDTVTCIVPDRRGLVWLCTPEGLVRFDGVEFRTYSTADGLPHREVTAFLQAADGTYWVGTGDGVAHTVARSSANVNATGPLFVALPAVNRGTTLPEPAVSSRAFKFEEAPVYVLHQDADMAVDRLDDAADHAEVR